MTVTTFDIDALDLVPQTTTDELADVADLGLMFCSGDTCHLWSCLGGSCWITI